MLLRYLEQHQGVTDGLSLQQGVLCLCQPVLQPPQPLCPLLPVPALLHHVHREPLLPRLLLKLQEQLDSAQEGCALTLLPLQTGLLNKWVTVRSVA